MGHVIRYIRHLHSLRTKVTLVIDSVAAIGAVGGSAVFVVAQVSDAISSASDVAGWIAFASVLVLAFVHIGVLPYLAWRESELRIETAQDKRSDAERRANVAERELEKRGALIEVERRHLAQLEERLAEYEEGPRFRLSIVQPVTIAQIDEEPDKVLLLFTVRCTNEGARGAAFDWLAVVVLPDQSVHGVSKVISDKLSFSMGITAEIKREDTIWERAGQALDRGDTVPGHFVGFVDAALHPALNGPCNLVIACKDHRGRIHGTQFPMTGGRISGQPVQGLAEPTLSRILFDADYHTD